MKPEITEVKIVHKTTDITEIYKQQEEKQK